MASRSCAGRPKPPGAVLCAVGRDGGAVKGGRASEPSADAICLPWQNALGAAVDARCAGSALRAAPGCRPLEYPLGAISNSCPLVSSDPREGHRATGRLHEAASDPFGAPPLAAAAAPPPVDWRASPAFSARERGETPRACPMSVIAPRCMDQAALCSSASAGMLSRSAFWTSLPRRAAASRIDE